MATGGNRERGSEFKSAYICSSDNYGNEMNGRSQVNQRFPAAWNNTHGHMHGGSSFSGGYDEPEAKRQRRIAKYKAYAVESKLKSSFRNGIRWVKIKCNDIFHR
ncbi:uncharacterized protein LOC111009876 [Momordica charantia]|uniref:Uncharacterized protein LOC111009876 n=1 Tax=Momordica charantia TaxID=3673 RepID=A0A6J1CB45_MOMCH|nr:uncharacterized protein LOC111009876 [Momordica charantia]